MSKLIEKLLTVNDQNGSKLKNKAALMIISQHIHHVLNSGSSSVWTFADDSKKRVYTEEAKSALAQQFQDEYQELLTAEANGALNNLGNLSDFFRDKITALFNEYGIEINIFIKKTIVEDNAVQAMEVDSIAEQSDIGLREEDQSLKIEKTQENINREIKKSPSYRYIVSALSLNMCSTHFPTVIDEMVAEYATEFFNITKKENSIYYELAQPTELKAIEVTSNLSRVNFYFSEFKSDIDSYDLQEAISFVRGKVSAAVYPPLPEMGCVSYDKDSIEISGMKDFTVMHPLNREHVEKTVCIADQFHILEWILTKARNSEVLPQRLYEQIRMDVRHRAKQLRAVAQDNFQSYQNVLAEISPEPNVNFKKIYTAQDTIEFTGRFVAFISDSYYFSAGDKAITLPGDVVGNQIRFARVGQKTHDYKCGESGYDMAVLLRPEGSASTHALIDSKIKHDSLLQCA